MGRSLCAGLACVLFVANAIAEISFDPDTKRTLCAIVETKGDYTCAELNVTTHDGYILTIFHIATTANVSGRPVVLLWHGLLDNSFTFVMNMANESLPYLLVDRGYDVWLGNSRGNVYGRNHVSLNTTDEKFWNFTWDETAKYDVPNTIDFILGQTGQPALAYVGHSQGTTQMFASLVQRWTNPAKVKLYAALAPVATVSDETSTILRALANPIVFDALHALIGNKAFLPPTAVIEELDPVLCRLAPIACETLIEAICGVHRNSFNASRMQVMGSHEPGGTSMKNMGHWAQMVRTGKYEMYDYGMKGNMEAYNQSKPPQYNLTMFPTEVPLALFTGDVDELADPTDVRRLLAALPTPPVSHCNQPLYAHLDFVWCDTAVTDIYEPVLFPLLTKYLPAQGTV